MYLKSLKLVGFKSFADRTQLELRPGVTVVVGPNGSGKSNLVDALSWVMGTQSTKALRTGRMEDVVFAGTATRPALNRAEVTLVIDNAERVLPLDLPEVSLTRRLYRDGSSDYEINGVGCRLLDIEELLNDSGVGRHQHVIIGQGEIGTILNASPEEHRAVVEEAAGILKHRRRKEKAERRLERTDEDMLRLQDLVTEIERQLRPLKRQASAAERYDAVKSEVRALGLYLARDKLARYEGEMGSLRDEQASLSSSVELGQENIVSISEELDRLSLLASTSGADLERDTGAAARIETTVERLRRMGSVAHERVRAAAGRQEAVIERRSDLEGELSLIRAESASLLAAETEALATAASREQMFRRLEDEERSLATQTALSPEGAAAAVRGELSALDNASARENREAESVADRTRVVRGLIEDETAEISRINEEIQSADIRLSDLSSVYDSATKARVGDQAKWSDAEEALAAARLEHAACSARVDATVAALEGSFDLEARRSAEGSSGSLGSLVGLLAVPEGLEKAVGTALGSWAGSVAFSASSFLKSAVEEVKRAGSGGIPLIQAMPEPECPAREAAAAAGVEALVDRLGAGHHRGLAAQFLGDVLMVEGWAAGWSLVAKHPNLRAVTPEGDLITSQGVLIAHPDGSGPAMLEAAEVGKERAATELARAISLQTSAKRDFEKSRKAERAALEAVEVVEVSLAGKTEAMARLQKSVDSLREEEDRLDERLRMLAENAADRDVQIAELRGRLAALEGEQAARLRAWQELEAQRSDLAAAREVARSEWQEAATHSRSVIERRRLLEERTQRIVADLARLDAPETSPNDPELLKQVEIYSRRAVEVLVSQLSLLRERQSRSREANSRAVSDLETARAEYEEYRTSISSNRERIGKIEVRLTELRLIREGLVESLRRDSDAEIEEASQAPRPDYPEDEDLDALYEEKATQLRRLGPINPLAAAEYRDLSQRYEFLTTQRADVETSRAELRKVISALETEIEARFQEAFAEVAEAYQRYFSILFPGGRGRIRLTDPDDRHSGLVIDAQPVGKKVAHMTLLSGGERSLAALAFLFSVFEARPSPFYVLDEVEAALDDANLRRFLRIVEEFRRRAQVIIVTHQQQTMEVADVLYGVTMEPGGSSQAIRKAMTYQGADQLA